MNWFSSYLVNGLVVGVAQNGRLIAQFKKPLTPVAGRSLTDVHPPLTLFIFKVNVFPFAKTEPTKEGTRIVKNADRW